MFKPKKKMWMWCLSLNYNPVNKHLAISHPSHPFVFKKKHGWFYIWNIELGTHTVTPQRACILFIFACGQHPKYSHMNAHCVTEWMCLWIYDLNLSFIILDFPIRRCGSIVIWKNSVVLISINKRRDENNRTYHCHILVSEPSSSCGCFMHTYLNEFTKLTTH